MHNQPPNSKPIPFVGRVRTWPGFAFTVLAIIVGGGIGTTISVATATENAPLSVATGVTFTLIAVITGAALVLRLSVDRLENDLQDKALRRLSVDQAEILRYLVESGEFDKMASDPLSNSVAAAAKDNLEALVTWLESGTVQIHQFDVYRYLHVMVGEARSRIRAISVLGPSRWWLSENGQSYLNANILAITRGVLIERIFIFYGEESHAVQELAAKQAESGINVALVEAADLPLELIRDFMIVDSSHALELHYDRRFDSVTGIALTNRSDEIDAYERAFDQIRPVTTQWRPPS